MRDRFPRTPAESRGHGRGVAMRCDCGATTWLRPENLIQRLGSDFDLYAGYAELLDAFPCEDCGRRQHPTFVDMARPASGSVSYEDATTHALELSAFALARDAAALDIPQDELRRRRREVYSGRYRKFGQRK